MPGLESEPPGPLEPIDEILASIINGYFLLTDGQGAVSKWSEPADLIFGRSAEEVLGHLLFESVVTGPVSSAGEAWKAFLEEGTAAGVQARVELGARNARGTETFPVELVFVPVKLDEGFDFSLFLEDLGFELPMNLMLMRLRQQHPVVVRALNQAISGEVTPWENWRTAGTLVVFRPLAPTPWIETELRRREARREEAASQIQEAMELSDPGIAGDSVVQLDDAAAVVARMLDALDRLAALEEAQASLPLQLEEARARAEAAESSVMSLREQLDHLQPGGSVAAEPSPEALQERAELLSRITRLEIARTEAEQRLEELRGAEAIRAELAERLEALEQQRAGGEDTDAVEARIQQAIAAAAADADARRAELEERLTRVESERAAAALADPQAGAAEQAALADALAKVEAERAAVSAALERLESERAEQVEAARTEVAAALERLQSERERDIEAAQAELAGAFERIEAAQREVVRMREQFGEATVGRAQAEGLAAEDRRRLEDLAREAEEARARMEAMRSQSDELRTEAAEVREEAAHLRAQLAAIAEQDSHHRSDLDAVRRETDELRTWLEQARADRDDAHKAAHRVLEQVEELRRKVDERPTAAQGGEKTVEMSKVSAIVDGAVGDVGRLRADAEALRARLEELAGEAETALRRAEEARAEVVSTRTEIVEVRGEAREAQRVARETGDRVDAIDRGAGNVLDEVKALRGRVEETAIEARTAQEALDARRADAEDVLATVTKLGAELAIATGRLDDVRDEAVSAREQAAAAAEVAGAANESALQAREDALSVRDTAVAAAAEARAAGEAISAVAADAASAMEAASAAGADAADARDVAGAAREAAATVEARIGTLDEQAASLSEELAGATARMAALGSDLDSVRADMEHAIADASGSGGGIDAAALDALRGEVAAAAEGLAAAQAEVEALRASAEEMQSGTAAAVEAAALARAEAQAGDARIEGIREEIAAVLGQLHEYKQGFEESRKAAVVARKEAEQARRAAEEARASSGGAGQEALTEIVRELVADSRRSGVRSGSSVHPGTGVRKRESGLHRRPASGVGPALTPGVASQSTPAAREPRAGFDDVDAPMAVLDLKGKFRELNPAFARLVGYEEAGFTKAMWPSVHDRTTLAEQQEEFARLAVGEIESLPVNSTYLHGQGLMVLVVGDISLVRDETGEPDHLIMRAEDRAAGH